MLHSVCGLWCVPRYKLEEVFLPWDQQLSVFDWLYDLLAN
jgi:hypothetical protein